MRIPSSCHGQNEKSNLTLLLRIHPLPTLQTQHPIWYLCGDPGGPFGALLIRAMRKRRQREAERLAPRESRCLFCCSHHLLRVFATASAASSSRASSSGVNFHPSGPPLHPATALALFEVVTSQSGLAPLLMTHCIATCVVSISGFSQRDLKPRAISSKAS
mmetsp:Transcript_49113/g.102191  ORF Transcript_49113/g.102191 Transcript_49113/m.102191 type:complete len:161 (-) Transcript_49113:1016-1498(-)